MRRVRSKLLGPDGKPLDPPTLLDYVQELGDPPLLPVVEALQERNKFLQDIPWKADVGRILDSRGRPYLRVVK
jgi:hypothetical protein